MDTCEMCSRVCMDGNALHTLTARAALFVCARSRRASCVRVATLCFTLCIRHYYVRACVCVCSAEVEQSHGPHPRAAVPASVASAAPHRVQCECSEFR